MRIRKVILISLLMSIGLICTGCVFDFLFISSNTEGKKENQSFFYDNDIEQSETTTETINTTDESTKTTDKAMRTQFIRSTETSTTTTTTTNTTETTQFTTSYIPIKKTEEVDKQISVETECNLDNEETVIEVTNEENNYETIEFNEEQQDNQDLQQTEFIPENQYEDVKDAVIIKDKVITIFYGPADQELVDEHDVVQDTEYWSNSTSKFLFGHSYGSLSCLSSVKVGETITLINDGIEKRYVVTISEKGEVTEDGFDIRSCSSDTMFISSDFGYDEDIRLCTCLGGFSKSLRWIVIGQLTE